MLYKNIPLRARNMFKNQIDKYNDNNIIDFSLAYTPEIQVDVQYKKYINKYKKNKYF